MIEALLAIAASNSQYRDIQKLLPKVAGTPFIEKGETSSGWVYLLKSGHHCKIGRSDTLERRIKQISISLPEATVLLHAIQTDDSVGIEKYWHQRFEARRANGEWFALTQKDITAFKRRKFM